MSATYNDVVLAYISREFFPLKYASKILGRKAGVSHRTAENWLAGTHAPSGEALVNLMSECNELAAEINALVAERRARKDHA